MTTPLRKLRTREHVIADLGFNHLERHVLLCGHSLHRILHDYGYDGLMTRYSDKGEIEPGGVDFQIHINHTKETRTPRAFPSEGTMRRSPPVAFADLRQLLLGLGFSEFVVPKSIRGFVHSGSETEIFLPVYRPNQPVAPHHLALVRIQLDAKGLLDGADFDRAVVGLPTKHSASS
jgi:hypothetical protein